jgi:transposase
MAITAQISKEKQQSLINLRHECESICKISRTLKVSSSAVITIIKRFDETVSHEDRHRKGRARVTSAAEDKFIQVNCTSDIAAQINASEFKKQTSQHQLIRGDCMNQAFMVQLLQRSQY